MWKAPQVAINVSADGWVNDGRERIAVAVEARAHRFFQHGIAVRRHLLTGRYLRGLVPVNHGAAVVNFGANIGEVAITLADRGAIVMAIEPDPKVVPALTANAMGRLIEVVPVAAWHTDGDLEMFIATEDADTSVFNESPERRTIPCRRIDSLVQEREIERVHLLVGDAEGGEPEVLQGAAGILPITDYVSVCASAERAGERTVDACEDLLRAAGFNILYREDEGFGILIAQRWPPTPLPGPRHAVG